MRTGQCMSEKLRQPVSTCPDAPAQPVHAWGSKMGTSLSFPGSSERPWFMGVSVCVAQRGGSLLPQTPGVNLNPQILRKGGSGPRASSTLPVGCMRAYLPLPGPLPSSHIDNGSPSLESLTAWPQPDLFPYIRRLHTLLEAGTWDLLPAWGWLEAMG